MLYLPSRVTFYRSISPVRGRRGKLGKQKPLFCVDCPPFVKLGVFPSGAYLDLKNWRNIVGVGQCSNQPSGPSPLSGYCPLGWEKALATAAS